MRADFFDKYEFFTGVPDSLLKNLCSHIMARYGISSNHVIAANEGNAVGIATGYYLSTGRTPVVYLQNSGLGNIINPTVSLTDMAVYGIPIVYIVGWRGEPGIHDEPQHMRQGEITRALLADIGISTYIVSKDSTDEEIESQEQIFENLLRDGRSVAWLIKKGAIEPTDEFDYTTVGLLRREEILDIIVKASGDNLIVSTTGKTSRELYELREKYHMSHDRDFLTVGSMGHASSIALGLAINMHDRRIWCIDGDGAALMHMGAFGVIGNIKPENLIHVVINNSAHESVGGFPTVAHSMSLTDIAEACGYPRTISVKNRNELKKAIDEITNSRVLTFVEVLSDIGARPDLGRPKILPAENKKSFMTAIKNHPN